MNPRCQGDMSLRSILRFGAALQPAWNQTIKNHQSESACCHVACVPFRWFQPIIPWSLRERCFNLFLSYHFFGVEYRYLLQYFQTCKDVGWHLMTRTCPKFVPRCWNAAITRKHFSSASWQIPSAPVFPWSILEDPFPCLGPVERVMSGGMDNGSSLHWVDPTKGSRTQTQIYIHIYRYVCM